MESEIAQLFNGKLTEFVSNVISEGIYPSKVVPDVIADRFVRYFDIACPITMAESSRLLSALSLTDVQLNPVLEDENKIRGMWAHMFGRTKIIIGGNRPTPCLIKTLLHELAEQMLEISYTQTSKPYKLSNKMREQWANRFAAMCKMPPELFMLQAIANGWNLRRLAERFEDTIAGVARQIRDIVAMDERFYSCRFDIVRNPRKACPNLVGVVQDSGGMAVLVHDVVKTRPISNRRRGGGLPQYVVPNSDHYRVVTPALAEMTTGSRPIYIPRLGGAASFENSFSDLFGYNDLAVIIQWYGSRRRVKGFFIAAVHPDNVGVFEKQLGDLNVEVRTDIGWLFSIEKEIRKRKKKTRPQPGLTMVEPDGTIKDMAELPLDWPKLPRLLIDSG